MTANHIHKHCANVEPDVAADGQYLVVVINTRTLGFSVQLETLTRFREETFDHEYKYKIMICLMLYVCAGQALTFRLSLRKVKLLNSLMTSRGRYGFRFHKSPWLPTTTPSVTHGMLLTNRDSYCSNHTWNCQRFIPFAYMFLDSHHVYCHLGLSGQHDPVSLCLCMCVFLCESDKSY